MKKLTAIIILTTMVLTSLFLGSCSCASSGSTVSIQSPTEPELKDEYGVGYKTNDDGTLAVTRYDGEDMDVSIPIDYDNKSVKNIAQSAFKGSEIESVTMPDGLKEIDGYAFALCKNLNIVNIPEGVTDIGENAFFATFALTEIELPKSLETLGINAFNASALTEIVIPENVKNVGEYAFADCSNLEEIKVLGKNTIIASNAFNTGTNTMITAPKGSSAIDAAKENNLEYTETK